MFELAKEILVRLNIICGHHSFKILSTSFQGDHFLSKMNYIINIMLFITLEIISHGGRG